MSRPVVVLRPEPGNAATAARVKAAGWTAVRLPLFVVRALPWRAPDPAGFDALLLTSANAPRLAGPAIARLVELPVLAVGVATADAARDAGLHVRLTGLADATSLLADARAMGIGRALHLAGQNRSAIQPPVIHAIAVYVSETVAIGSPRSIRALEGSAVLVHSPRAAERFAELVDEAGAGRATLHLVALSAAVARAAGEGWGGVAVAAVPSDASLLDAARIVVG